MAGTTTVLDFAKATWNLAAPFWVNQDRQSLNAFGITVDARDSWISRGILVTIIILTISNVYILIALNSWTARLFNSLQAKNIEQLSKELWYWLMLAAIFTVTNVYRLWLTQHLVIRWRCWLSEAFISNWLRDGTHYRLELANGIADNPEQRIEEDCNQFVTNFLNISLGALQHIAIIGSFFSILWSLSGTLILPIFGGVSLPGYMMWATIGYAVLGSWLTHVVGRPLAAVNFNLERYSADFRCSMTRVRDNCESIALLRGEGTERLRLITAIGKIRATWSDYMRYTKNISWISSCYGQAATIFPIIIAAPQYFSNKIELGGLVQSVGAFTQVQSSLSWFIDNYTNLSAWKAAADRLNDFSDQIILLKLLPPTGTFEVRQNEIAELLLHDVEIHTPTGITLVRGLNFCVKPQTLVRITGQSGSGKSVILRAISGVWPFGRGLLDMPNDFRVHFIPASPYLPDGTLEEALSYPHATSTYPRDAYSRALSACNASHLRQRLTDTANWQLILSAGEQQSIALARAFLYRPNWLFMDQSTSALDSTTAGQIYKNFRLQNPELAIITIDRAENMPQEESYKSVHL
jgi:vitamin B12/bleomycin/antimicrobial peptide transport system ATP-binding/permease protein